MTTLRLVKNDARPGIESDISMATCTVVRALFASYQRIEFSTGDLFLPTFCNIRLA